LFLLTLLVFLLLIHTAGIADWQKKGINFIFQEFLIQEFLIQEFLIQEFLIQNFSFRD